MQVFKRVLNSSIEEWLSGASASRAEICTAETLFLPTADSFADLMQFVSQNAQQGGAQDDAEVERIVQAYTQYKQQQSQQQQSSYDQQQQQGLGLGASGVTMKQRLQMQQPVMSRSAVSSMQLSGSPMLLRDPAAGQPSPALLQPSEQMPELQQPVRRDDPADAAQGQQQQRVRRSASGRPCPTDSEQQQQSAEMQTEQTTDVDQQAQPARRRGAFRQREQQDTQQMQQQQQQQAMQGDCPEPPYTPGEAASDFPAARSESIEQRDRTEASSEQLLEPSDSARATTTASPLLELRLYKLSAFMQRAITASIGHALLPFAYLSSDAPIHLIAPTMLVDPMFVNKNQQGQQQQQEQTQQQQESSDSADDQSSALRSKAALTFGSPWSRVQQRDSAFLSQSKLKHSPMQKAKLFSWAGSGRKLSGKQMKMSRFATGSGAYEQRQAADSQLGDADADSASYADTQSSLQQRSRRRYDDDSDSAPKSDADLDLKIARAFGVTPAEVAAPFRFSSNALFSSASNRAQVVHLEKTEKGVAALQDSPFSVFPTAAVIVSPDIRVRDGVLQVTATPVATPVKSSAAMRMNGLLAAKAAFKAAGQQVADAVDYEPAVTIFAPQDSSLTALMQQLPKDKLQKLIKAVARYKRKKAKVEQMLQRISRGQFDEERQQQQTDDESAEQYEQYDDADSQQQLSSSSRLGLTGLRSAPVQQHPLMMSAGPNVHSSSSVTSFDVNSGSHHTSSRSALFGARSSKLRGLKGSKLKLKAADSDSDSDDRSAALAQALASMQADLPFNLARWCEQNGIAVDQQQQTEQTQTQEGQHGTWQPEEGAQAGGFEQQEQQQPRITQDQLRALAQSHIFRGVVHSPDFADGLTLNSLSGAAFSFKCNDGSWSFGGANVIFTDILTKNGVVSGHSSTSKRQRRAQRVRVDGSECR